MPSATVGPGAMMDPPCAAIPLTVSNACAVSTDHSVCPSVLERAHSRPSDPPTKTTPGTTVAAAEYVTFFAGEVLSGVYQVRCPSDKRTAATPPRFNPKYA